MLEQYTTYFVWFQFAFDFETRECPHKRTFTMKSHSTRTTCQFQICNSRFTTDLQQWNDRRSPSAWYRKSSRNFEWAQPHPKVVRFSFICASIHLVWLTTDRFAIRRCWHFAYLWFVIHAWFCTTTVAISIAKIKKWRKKKKLYIIISHYYASENWKLLRIFMTEINQSFHRCYCCTVPPPPQQQQQRESSLNFYVTRLNNKMWLLCSGSITPPACMYLPTTIYYYFFFYFNFMSIFIYLFSFLIRSQFNAQWDS